MVDPIHSTSPAIQTYHHFSSVSVEIPLVTTAGNYSSIGKEPVSQGKPIPSIRKYATSIKVSFAEQGGINNTITNVLQGHKTVVVVCYISERKPNINCTWKLESVCVVDEILLTNSSPFPQVTWMFNVRDV